jgi:hypothetical protein
MTFVLAVVLQVAAGFALLRLLRLGTGGRVADAGLAWLVGTGWLASVAPIVRFGLGIPFGRVTLAAILLAPMLGWAVVHWRKTRLPTPSPPATDTPSPPQRERAGRGGFASWLPRPIWLFAPIIGYVVLVTAMVALHGINTPTQTDDGIRVRAFAPILAFVDAWPPEARGVFSVAGALPTFAPAVGWIATGTVDHFHVNYAVLGELVALLLLTVGLGAARGNPARGWAEAFGILSIPLFVYHCTSTYSDAVLAMRVGAGVLFMVEYARTRDHADAARALLLLGLAALVKREGELVAAAPAAVLVAQLAWERLREARPFPWRALALLAAPVALEVLGKISAVGLAGAFPMLGFVVQQAEVAAGAGPQVRPAALTGTALRFFFDQALFRSGNQGMLYWIALGVIAVRARSLVRGSSPWALLAVAALFCEVAVSSILLVPEFTYNQGTVHRALLVVTVPLALWIAAVIADAAHAEATAVAGAPAEQAPPADLRGGREATPPARRRSRRGSRR